MKRIAITGIGILSSIGNGKAQFLQGLLESKSGTREVKSFDINEYPFKNGAEIHSHITEDDKNDKDDVVNKGLIAAKEAVKEAQIIKVYEPNDIGVSIATSLGGVKSREKYYIEKNRGNESNYNLLLNVPTPCLAGSLSHAFNFRGPSSTVVTACAAGGNALGIAADLIKQGKAKAMLVGGVDPFSTISFSGFSVLRSLSPNVTKPFNETRDGLTLGEASAFLIFEDMESALQREAKVYAEFLGYGISNDAYHITSPDPDGGGAFRSMEAALDDANLSSADISYINAHGTGTPYNDQMEIKAIKRLLGNRRKEVPISSSKSQFGHTLGTAGVIEAIVCTLAIKHSFLPATINFEKSIDSELDFVPNAIRKANIDYVLSNSFAFGGNTASIIIGKV